MGTTTRYGIVIPRPIPLEAVLVAPPMPGKPNPAPDVPAPAPRPGDNDVPVYEEDIPSDGEDPERPGRGLR